jgi:inorganic pyrophosphatase
VLVETPQGSRKKYEYDHERHAMRLDRRLFSATVYPADYGFVPGTVGADGEALDALVLSQDPTFPGCWVAARPIGVFWLSYEGHEDEREAKIITVPAGDPDWEEVEELSDLPHHVTDEISHFFDVYKDLEPSRTPNSMGFDDRKAALAVLEEARARAAEEGSD